MVDQKNIQGDIWYVNSLLFHPNYLHLPIGGL